jgi:hypothetical protein
MVTYFLTIDHVLSSDPKVLARVIPTMERAQGLLGILEVVSDCQPLPALRVLVIIEPINIVHSRTVFKCNNTKIELTMKEKYCRPISVYKELTFVKLILRHVRGVQNYCCHIAWVYVPDNIMLAS